MRKITLLDRIRYRFDNLMARGTIALIGWLFVASLLLVLIVSLIVVLLGEGPAEGQLSFAQAAWMSMLRTLDPGTMGDDRLNPPQAAML